MVSGPARVSVGSGRDQWVAGGLTLVGVLVGIRSVMDHAA